MDLYGRYRRKLPGKVAALAQRIEAIRDRGAEPHSLRRAQRAAHQLAGTAGSYGFAEVSGSARALEESLGAGSIDWAGVQACLGGLTGAVSRLHPGRGASARAPSARVLLCEPDLAQGERARELGARQLVEVTWARDAESARGLLPSAAFDAAIVAAEAGAPGDRFRLARELRSLSGRQLPIAAAADDDSLEVRVEAARAGADVFLSKPLSRAALDDALTTLLTLGRATRPRVLCFDDDPDFLAWVRDALAGDEIEVSAGRDPRELLERLAEVEPDALLVDFDMPSIDGLQVCSLVRANRRWKDLPICFVTGQPSRELRLSAFESGCDDYFVKPVRADELRVRLRARVGRSRLCRAHADRDALTGLSLRSIFLADLEARLSQAIRRGDELSICLVDLDRFKEVNDRHGHLAGDRVLAAVGALFVARFRGGDLRARWGGEEFALAFPSERAGTVCRMVERALAELGAVRFEDDRGEAFRVSFSAGVAQFPDDGASVECLLRAADRRLYRAKRMGRSRVVADDEEAAA